MQISYTENDGGSFRIRLQILRLQLQLYTLGAYQGFGGRRRCRTVISLPWSEFGLDPCPAFRLRADKLPRSGKRVLYAQFLWFWFRTLLPGK